MEETKEDVRKTYRKVDYVSLVLGLIMLANLTFLFTIIANYSPYFERNINYGGYQVLANWIIIIPTLIANGLFVICTFIKGIYGNGTKKGTNKTIYIVEILVVLMILAITLVVPSYKITEDISNPEDTYKTYEKRDVDMYGIILTSEMATQ